MRTASTIFLFTVALSLMLLISDASSGKLYETVCKKFTKAEDNTRCLQMLKSEPDIVAAKDVVKLNKAFLEMAVKKATDGQNYLKELMKSNPKSSAIKICATQHYNYVVNSFKSSLGEIKLDASTANYDSKVAGDGADYCDSAMADEKLVNPSITALNSEVKFLSYIAFFVTDMLDSDSDSE